MDIRLLVGKNIRRCRQAGGLSQEELAARIDADQGYVSRLEAGSRNPTVETIGQISRALDVPPAALFDSTARSPKPRTQSRK
jgi:transcriptional regulator with XRE-family HTH domain